MPTEYVSYCLQSDPFCQGVTNNSTNLQWHEDYATLDACSADEGIVASSGLTDKLTPDPRAGNKGHTVSS